MIFECTKTDRDIQLRLKFNWCRSSLWRSSWADPDCLQFPAGLKKKKTTEAQQASKAARNNASELTKWPASNTDGYPEIPCEFLSCMAYE